MANWFYDMQHVEQFDPCHVIGGAADVPCCGTGGD